jgi:hypothetical protein
VEYPIWISKKSLRALNIIMRKRIASKQPSGRKRGLTIRGRNIQPVMETRRTKPKAKKARSFPSTRAGKSAGKKQNRAQMGGRGNNSLGSASERRGQTRGARNN